MHVRRLRRAAPDIRRAGRAQIGRDGASLTTPFSKVEVPGTYITDPAATRQAFAALQAAALPALQSLQPAKDLAAALAPAAALLADPPAPAAAP